MRKRRHLGLLTLCLPAALMILLLSGTPVLAQPDRAEWIVRYQSSVEPEHHRRFSDVAFGSDRYVAIKRRGSEKVFTSSDGVVWTGHEVAAGQLNRIIHGGGQFVAVGGGGSIITSPDGESWTDRTSGTAVALNGVAHGQGRYVVVGAGMTYLPATGGRTRRWGEILTSPDGTVWTDVTPADILPLSAVTYGGGQFVAVGPAGTTLTSADGQSWVLRTSSYDGAQFLPEVESLPGGPSLYDVAYGNGLFVAVGEGGAIITSADGVTWTPADVGADHDLEGIAFGAGLFVTVGTLARAGQFTGGVFSSADGAEWVPETAPESEGLHGATYGAGQFIAVGGAGVILARQAVGDEPIHVLVDGYYLGFDVPPRIDRGRTLVPWRWLLEFYGFEVHYEAESRRIVTWDHERRIEMQIGSPEAFVGHEVVTLDVPPQELSGRTLVPLRFVSEALGYTVDWDETTRTVAISGHSEPAASPPALALDEIRTVRRLRARPETTEYRTLSMEDPHDRERIAAMVTAWQAAVPAVHPGMSEPMPPYGTGVAIETESGTVSFTVAWECEEQGDTRRCGNNDAGFVYLHAGAGEPTLVHAPGLTRFWRDFPTADDNGDASPAEKASKPEESFVITHTVGLPNCPDAQALRETDPSDRETLRALLPAIIPALYAQPEHQNYQVTRVEMAAEAGVRGEHVTSWCDADVAASTWVVFLQFPDFAPSASMTTGLFYVAKEDKAWNVWHRYR